MKYILAPYDFFTETKCQNFDAEWHERHWVFRKKLKSPDRSERDFAKEYLARMKSFASDPRRWPDSIDVWHDRDHSDYDWALVRPKKTDELTKDELLQKEYDRRWLANINALENGWYS